MRVRARAAALAVAAVAVAPAEAGAEVTIGDAQVVVSTDGGRATIDRSPFRIAFADASGGTALAQVPNAVPAPLPVAGVDPVPGGSENYAGQAQYAPLSFTVGARNDLLYPGGQWGGDQLAGIESGVVYSARDVVDAKPAGDGVELTLSTTDPSGRVLVVRVAPGPGGTLSVSARPSPADGVEAMADSFQTRAGQPFHGFGGRHNRIDQRGGRFYNWVAQQNVGPGSLSPLVTPLPGMGGDRYQFPNGEEAAYYVQSQFVSDTFGFLLDRDELSLWRMASDRDDAWQVGVAAAGIDYTVAPGDADAAIDRLTRITGRHRVAPDWALGSLMDRLVKYPSQGAETYKREVEDDLAKIAQYDIPVTGYRIESWEYYARDELRSLMTRMRDRKIMPLVYFRAFVGQDDIGTDRASAFDEARDRGYLTRRATGEPYIYVTNFNSPGGLIDFTNPDAVKWWQGRVREALELGAEGFMQDFGEQVQVDMHFADGTTGAQTHNRYPVLFHRATREVVEEFEREHPNREIFFYTRAGYSGRPGSAAYENANFTGDANTTWERSFGLASMTTDMLNRQVGGLYGFNQDIGGYFDVGPYEPTSKELFIRWAEHAVFTPVFRLHGSVGAGTHMPWTYDDETIRIYRQMARLHVEARPLIKRLWREAVRTGTPIARPLWLAYPGDAEAAKQDQEWLLGPDVLVAPVVEQGATAREVYFPRGCWQDANTAAVHSGPRSVRVEAPLERLPWFVRCGTDPLAEAAGESCRDRASPLSRVTRVRATRRRVSARGRSYDRGCRLRGRVRAAGLRRVHVSVARVRGRSCRFVDRRGRLLRRARSCRRPLLLPARGTKAWRFALRSPRGLPRGRYRIQVRATDLVGNKERPRQVARGFFRVR